MNKNRKRIGELARRWAGSALIVTLIAGSVSLASFADMGYVDSVFGVRAEGEPVRLTATSSEPLATSSSARLTNRPSLPELLEQSADNDNAIVPTWYQVALNGSAIADSDNWDITIRRDQRIRTDTLVRHQLRVTIYPERHELGEGDSVTWNLGRIEGLSLDGEFWEELVLTGGVYVGDVMLTYTEDSEVFLYTEFKEAVNRYSSITITYWYDCGFITVNEPTGIVFDLPGYEEAVQAVLVPEDWDENETTTRPSETTPEETTAEETTPEETTREETTPEESSPQETTPAETTPEETTPAETTPEETTPEETTPVETTPPETTPAETVKPTKGSDSGGDSDRAENTLAKETTKSAETVPESTAETETETPSQPEVPQTQEQSPQDTQDEQSEGEPGESDGTEPEEVLDINISFGAEVAASHGMQSRVLPNEVLTYRMVLSNDSGEEIRDVRIRDYLPDHTSFVSTGEDGIYGVADGRQYITWMLESIPPGEEVELTFQVKVFPCTPPDYPIRNHVYWQADDSRSAGNQERPDKQVDFPMITIG